MKTTIVTLGGVDHKISELPALQNEAWRSQLQTQLGPILTIIEQAGSGLDLNDRTEVLHLAHNVGQMLIQSPKVAADLLFAYAPDLAMDADLILETAYDSELIAAFVSVLGLAYPFASLAKLFNLGRGMATNGMFNGASLNHTG